MKSVALIVALLAFAAPALAAIMPLPERNLSRETILERLVDSQDTMKSWNLTGAKTRLEKLASDLTPDSAPFNQAVRKKCLEIVSEIDASHLRDAESKLGTLIQAVRDGVMPNFVDPAEPTAI